MSIVIKTFLIVSCFLLGLSLAAIVYRLGGPAYAYYRLTHPEAGQYEHRRTMYEHMPSFPGAVIFLGDSHIAGCEWHEVFPSVPVLNRGIAGDHIAGVKNRLPEIFRHQPAVIAIQVGINDLLFGKTPENIARDYGDLLREILKNSPETKIIAFGLMPANPSVKWIRLDNSRVRQLNDLLRPIALQYGAKFVDLYPFVSDAALALDRQYTTDGIHLNGSGYARWIDVIPLP